MTVQEVPSDTGGRSSVWDRTGTAPISWGVCEVPGWGVQLPPDRVLSEMHQLGFRATELGSAGYLPEDPTVLRRTLADHDLTLTGGFVALVLHDEAVIDETLRRATEAAELLADAGARNFVSCAVSDVNDWSRPELSDDQWATLARSIEQVDTICTERGLQQVFHCHVDSLVETAEEVERVLASTTVRFVLETGHMSIGGLDPLEFATRYPDRVGLVHLKDVRHDIADQLNADELSLMEAVQAGLFPSLGDGDVPLAETIRTLEQAGYRGLYVIEQDAAITGELPAEGEGPVTDVRRSAEFIRTLDRQLEDPAR